jgi:hypothetical protein
MGVAVIVLLYGTPNSAGGLRLMLPVSEEREGDVHTYGVRLAV